MIKCSVGRHVSRAEHLVQPPKSLPPRLLLLPAHRASVCMRVYPSICVFMCENLHPCAARNIDVILLTALQKCCLSLPISRKGKGEQLL